MKKVIYAFFLSVIVLYSVVADDESVVILQNRLRKINCFYVRFIQKIVTIDDGVLLESYGELWVKHPNLFNWHMISPGENSIISDGKTIWFYNPAIKQVTAYWLQNFSHNIFFMLFFDSDKHQWNNYDVLQHGDFFSIKPVCNNVDFKECKIKIVDSGIIESLIFLDERGQYVDYCLRDYNRDTINLRKFHFILSKDIQLDDQRE